MTAETDKPTFQLDMTMMFAMHDALRRDAALLVEHARRVAAREAGDVAGWRLFATYLDAHHASEDATVWPVMRSALADQPMALSVLDAMEAEHAGFHPLIDRLNAAFAEPGSDPDPVGTAEEFVSLLVAHLAHEEQDGLPLIDATMTPAEWKHFGEDHRERIGPDSATYLPWLLEDADPERAATILSRIPEPMQDAYHNEWAAAYAQFNRWSTNRDN